MIPDISRGLLWLEANPTVINTIGRGLEREALRVSTDGSLANSRHPKALGSALKHEWITTDFSEALLEFVTPTYYDSKRVVTSLRDIHCYVAHVLSDEYMWPFSMPCTINDPSEIQIAQYGSSNIGRIKTLYRQGLKNRYGSLMQVIAGIHYNFSLSPLFWQEWGYLNKIENHESYSSEGYLHIIRNYYRYGWVIPYLFGASPAICASFLQGRDTHLRFEGDINETVWLPHATSLRLSQLGYTNRPQIELYHSLNSLHEYINTLRLATKTLSEEFSRIGKRDTYGNLLQLNTNLLQVENELYASIRPKRNLYESERPSDALARGGIEYIEIRSLDVNPFSEIGIEPLQLKLIDLFLIWCTLAGSPEMSSNEFLLSQENWNRVVLTGRQSNQRIDIGGKQYPLAVIGKRIVSDLRYIAKVLDDSDDNYNKHTSYTRACDRFYPLFEDSSLTYSARILDMIRDNGFTETGVYLANKYSHSLLQSGFETLSLEDFSHQASQSRNLQKQQEEIDTSDFDSYLNNYQG